MVKKGVSSEIYSGTVRTFFTRKKADEFAEYAANLGYRTKTLAVPQLDEQGAGYSVTVLPKALPDQEPFRKGG